MARMAVQFCLCNSRALRSQKGKALPSNPGSPLQVQSSLWATNISQVLRPYVAPLYRLLHSPPGANISISHSLDSRAVLAREITGRNLPLKSRVIEIGSTPIYCKADLLTVAYSPVHWPNLGMPVRPILPTTQDDQFSRAKPTLVTPMHASLPRLLCHCLLSSVAWPGPTPWRKETKWEEEAGCQPDTASHGLQKPVPWPRCASTGPSIPKTPKST